MLAFLIHPCGHQTPIPGRGDHRVSWPCAACREAASTRPCRAWLDCGHTAVRTSDLSFRGFCPDCERVATS